MQYKTHFLHFMFAQQVPAYIRKDNHECYPIKHISDHATIYTTYLIMLPYILHISDHVTIYTTYLIMLPYILYI